MLISTLTLYSTPFTPSYRNVLTGRSSALSDLEFKSVFTQISNKRGHEPLIWGLVDDTAKPKSFKYRNSRCVVNVPYLCNDLLPYNYCVTYYSRYDSKSEKWVDEYTYWFVESIESLNDATTKIVDVQKPCTSITLLRDCWTNNEKELHNIGKTMEYQMGHNYNDLTISQATIYNTLPPLQYDFQDYHTPYIYNNRYQVLWAKYTLDRDVIYTADITQAKVVAQYTSIRNIYRDGGSYPIVVSPFLIYDTKEQRYISDEDNTTFQIYSSKSGKIATVNSKGVYAHHIPSSTHVLKVEYTFCVPFKYSFEPYGTLPSNIYRATIEDFDLEYSSPDDDILDGIGYCVYITYEDYTENYPNHYNECEQIEIYSNTVETPITIWKEYELKNNYYCQKYPYSFKAIYVNGNYTDLFIPHNYSYIFIKYYRYRNFPCYQIEYYSPNNEVVKSNYYMISNKGELLTHSTQYDAYMRNNGNMVTAKAIGALWDFIGASVGGAKGRSAINAINDLRDTARENMASQIDLANRQDLINSPSYDANGAIYNQDLLLCFDCKPNNLNQDLIATTSQRFGSNAPFVKPFNAHYARNFEYAEIPNPNITLSNADDTIIVNNALNKGLTQWLVDRPDNLEIFTDVDLKALAYLNTNVSNPYFTGSTT